ncbi:MAG: LamG-like jellyroll fold domain-containing protein [Candidatus Paceibacterota bacterium]|jgi:hypothetical protein
MSLLTKYSTPAERLRGCTFADQFEDSVTVEENGGIITGATFSNLGCSIVNSSDKIIYPYTIKHTSTTPISVIADVTCNAATGVNQYFATIYDASSRFNIAFLYHLDGVLAVYNNSAFYKATVGTSFSGRHKFAVSISGTTATFYVDGAQIGATVVMSYGNFQPVSIKMGNAATDTRPLNGTMRSLKVFKTALTSQEILDNYTNSTYSYENKTFIDLEMKLADHDGIANTTHDSSRNGYVMNLGAAAASRPTKLVKRGYSFDGGDYIISNFSFNSRTWATLGGGYTYEVIASHTTTNREILINWQGSGNMVLGFRETTSYLYFVTNSTSAKVSTTEVKPYEVAHIILVVTYDPATFATVGTIYYNGKSVYSISGGTLDDFTKYLLVGGTGGLYSLYGNIYKARIWQQPLTPIQVADCYLKAKSAMNEYIGVPAPSGFKTEWVVAAGDTVTLPLVEHYNTSVDCQYNCTVDWGDGSTPSTVTAFNDARRIHTYTNAGTYNIEIKGTCEGWSFNNGGDKLKITKILNWGDPSVFFGFKYLAGGFYGCTNLTSLGTESAQISSGIALDGFTNTFRDCTGLTWIPSKLFYKNTTVTTSAFNGTFRDCSNIEGIPAGLFDKNTLASTSGFADTFLSCSSITSIPAHLFDNNTLVSTSAFYRTFYGCGNIASIPTDLFKYNTAVSTLGFRETFWGCSGITSIPADLFRYNVNLTTNGFYNTFLGTDITSIPTDLFRYNTLVSTSGFYGTFNSCTSLTSIPTDLFRYNTLVSTAGFRETFGGCTSLTSIPTDLFRYNTAVTTTGFQSTFYGCTTLTSIPTDLFRYNTAVSTTGFLGTFQNCTSLTSIPTDLFRYNTAVTSNGFRETFSGCSSLASVPTDLFRYNINVSSSGFYRTFYSCGLLETIPIGFFKYNTSASTTTFNQTFSGCNKLQLNTQIFCLTGEEDTRFFNKTSDFTNCFFRTAFTGTQGTAPELWNYNYGEIITLDVAPATDWAAGDTITGLTSGATAEVVSKITALTYYIKKHFGTFSLGEIVGVVGVPAKLADQGAANPTFTNTPTSTNCYAGVGNSGTSLTNYAAIPTSWKT